MHVALLIGSLVKGGSERVVVNIADFLVKRGHQVTVVTQYQLEDEYSLNGKVKRILSDITNAEITKNRVINFIRRFRKLSSIWQHEKPDIIISFIGKNNLMAVLTTRFTNISVAVAVRGAPDAEYYTPLLRWSARFFFRFADGVILQTEGSRKWFPEAVARKAVILRNPVNQKFFRPRFEAEREKTIVAVGRIDENKNHWLLIKAFSQIASLYPDYQLIIYGDGELQETLEAEVEEMGLAKQVHFAGKSDQIEVDIYRSSVYVLPSNTEGSPNSLIEAMLLGLACIATDCPCGGPADLIEHGKNGLLTQPQDIDKMKENLQYMLSNRQLAEEMGRNAHKLQNDFEPQNIIENWERFLREKCGNDNA